MLQFYEIILLILGSELNIIEKFGSIPVFILINNYKEKMIIMADHIFETESKYPLILNPEQLPKDFDHYLEKINRPPLSLKEKIEANFNKCHEFILFNQANEIANKDIYSFLVLCVMLYLSAYFIGWKIALSMLMLCIFLIFVNFQPMHNQKKIGFTLLFIFLLVAFIVIYDRIGETFSRILSYFA